MKENMKKFLNTKLVLRCENPSHDNQKKDTKINNCFKKYNLKSASTVPNFVTNFVVSDFLKNCLR